MTKITWNTASSQLKTLNYAGLEALAVASMTARVSLEEFGGAMSNLWPRGEWRKISKRRARKLNKRGETVVFVEGDGDCYWYMVKDLHRLRAAEMFGVGYPDVSDIQRKAAKSAYWLLNYRGELPHETNPTSRSPTGTPTIRQLRPE